MSPRVEVAREHVIIQSVGITILLDRDQLRHAEPSANYPATYELGKTSFDIWQHEIAGSPLGDDRFDAPATDEGERA